MELRLELIVLPVSNVDRSKEFYKRVGFREDIDYAIGEDFRIVVLTPPGSPAAIVIGRGVTNAEPGSVAGLHLSVSSVTATRDELIGRGIDVGEVFHDVGGVFHHASPAWEIPGPDPAGRDGATFARFADPDGNEWLLHEMTPSGSPGAAIERRMRLLPKDH